LPELPTFEEFFESSLGRQPSGISYEAMRVITDAQTAMFRTFFMPPKVPQEAVNTMRTALVELWKNPQFISDYAKAVKSDPVLVKGEDGAEIMARLGKVRPELKTFLKDYGDDLLKK
jgi:hypothetical protein